MKPPNFTTNLHQYQEPDANETTGTTITSATDASETQPYK